MVSIVIATYKHSKLLRGRLENLLAQNVIDLVGSRSKLVYKPLPSDDPKQRCSDITLAKEKLGWQPAVPLQVGLKKTIEYFDRLLGAKQTCL